MTIGEKTVERLRKFTERLESGEPIPATIVTQHETLDGPMHTFEKTMMIAPGVFVSELGSEDW
jgi:hypothetical protein